MRRDIFLMPALLWIAGCGGGDESADANRMEAANTSAAPPASQTVAAAATDAPQVDCAKVKGQAAPQGQPADDILGLRQGMTIGAVRDVLQCRNASYAIATDQTSVSLPSGGRMSRVNLRADTGLDKVTIWLVGPSGREQVIHVDRTIEYTDGKELPVASIEQELNAKYGSFDEASYGESGAIVRSRDGQKLTPENSNYGVCRRQTFQTDGALPCLNVVTYEIRPDSQNPQLASRFTVAVTSHAKAYDMVQVAEQQKAADVERARESISNGGLDL